MFEYMHEDISDEMLLQAYFIPISCSGIFVAAHWHNHMEIILMTNGIMTAAVGSDQYQLKRNDMLIVSPSEIHSTLCYGKAEYILLQISEDRLRTSLPDFDILSFRKYYPADEKISLSGQMKDCIYRMQTLFTEKQDGYQLRFSSVLYEFMYLLYRHNSLRLTRQDKTKAVRDMERIEKVMRFIKENFRSQITLSDAAAQISITPEYFCRLFRNYTGQTFLEYLSSVRLVNFYDELIATDQTITSLLEKNGITNYKVFLKLFRKTYGTSPQQFRKSAGAVQQT